MQIVAGFKGQCDCHIYYDTHATVPIHPCSLSDFTPAAALRQREQAYSVEDLLSASWENTSDLPDRVERLDDRLVGSAIDDIASVESQRTTAAKFVLSIAALGNPRTHAFGPLSEAFARRSRAGWNSGLAPIKGE